MIDVPPFTGRAISVYQLERLRQLVYSLRPQPGPGLRATTTDGIGTRLSLGRRPSRRPFTFPWDALGITLVKDAQNRGKHTDIEIAGRRIKLQQPATVTTSALVIFADALTINCQTAWNAGTPDGDNIVTVEVWLNYNLETEDKEISTEEGADSALRLYEIKIEKHEGEGEEDPATYTATPSRIYRPGDVDIEAVWLDYPVAAEE